MVAKPHKRWTLANILPVTFVAWIINSIGFAFLYFRLLPRLTRPGFSLGGALGDPGAFGEVFAIPFFIFMVHLNLLLAICLDPGSVPTGWEKQLERGASAELLAGPATPGQPLVQLEMKHTGARRYCKWCQKYKPDRCHHCRVCKKCVLRMDHHCPWIANCVGHKNHKCFILLVFYSILTTISIAHSLWLSVEEIFVVETTWVHRNLLMFGLTLSSIMAGLLTVFFLLHSWLMFNDMTTIEYCEKTTRKIGSKHSLYDRGLVRNLLAVLGPRPYLWLLPVDLGTGDGLHFPSGLADPDKFADKADAVAGSGSGVGSPGPAMPAPALPAEDTDAIPEVTGGRPPQD